MGSCPSGGWRKNLRDNTFTGVTPLPDLNEQVDEDCDGVDLNRNYQLDGALGADHSGHLYAGRGRTCGHLQQRCLQRPGRRGDNDGDGQINEDHVVGKDDADSVTDEDWWWKLRARDQVHPRHD